MWIAMMWACSQANGPSNPEDTAGSAVVDSGSDTGEDTLPGWDLVINEIMSGNQTTIADQAGEFDDWFELFNPGDEAASLDGFGVTDDFGAEDPWMFPDGLEVPAGGFLLIWADEGTDQGDDHTSFKLSGDGETLTVVDAAGDPLTEVVFPALNDDESYFRTTDGGETWATGTATPEMSNTSK